MEQKWLRKTLAMAVKTYASKAEIQLFANSFSFYFYMAKNIKDLMQSLKVEVTLMSH